MADAKITLRGIAGFDSAEMRKAFGLDNHGRARKALDIEVIEQCMPYVPMANGFLAESPYTNPKTDIGAGTIVYSGPYAHYQYVGIVYAPNIPTKMDGAGNVIEWRSPPGKGTKHPTNRSLQYNQEGGSNALRGPEWDKRMVADHMKDLTEACLKAMVSGNE